MLFSGVAMADGLQGSVKWPLALVLGWHHILVLSHFASGWTKPTWNLPRNSVCSSLVFFFQTLYLYTFPGNVLMGGGHVKYLYNVLRGQINSKGRQWNTSQNLYINKNTQVWDWIIQEFLHRLGENIEWFQEQCLLNACLYCLKWLILICMKMLHQEGGEHFWIYTIYTYTIRTVRYTN